MNEIASEVWGVEDTAVLPGGITFPLRMSVVRLPDESLWLHSPVSIDDETAHALDAIGTVRHIVAPSLMHTLHIEAAQTRWPDASLYAPAAMRSHKPHLRVDVALEALTSGAWHSAFHWVLVEGAPMLDEFAFFHTESRTAFLTDLVFNFDGANVATRMLLRAVGCHGSMASSRSWGWFFARNKGAVAQSVKQILAWPIERVVPCHGDVVTTDANGTLSAAVARLTAWDRASGKASG